MATNTGLVFPSERRVEVTEHPIPEPGPREVLIEVTCSLVSTGSELAGLSNEPIPGLPDNERVKTDLNKKFPRTNPGRSVAGKIIEAGDGVPGDVVGQRVISRQAHHHYVTAKMRQSSAHDEHIDPNSSYWPIPDGVSDEQALFGTQAQIPMNAVRRGRLSWGERVVVFGLGVMGQLTARLCHVAGARPVIGLDLSESRRGRFPDYPGVEVVDATADDWPDRVSALMNSELAEVVFEFTGNPAVVAKELSVLQKQGRIVIGGSPRGPTPFDFNAQCSVPSYEIIGAHRSSYPQVPTPQTPWTQERSGDLFLSYLADGKISVDGLVSHRVQIENAPEAYEMLLEDRREALGVVFHWE